jgi:RNA polymerase sigma-70 factor (ECF subfamily)
MPTSDTKQRLSNWFRQWRAPLRKFLSGKATLPRADLEDICQEVFLRLLRYDRSDLVRNPHSYLFKMASNVAAEWSIRMHVRQPHDSEWLLPLIEETQPEDLVSRESSQKEIERALNTLAPRHQEILKLQFNEGLGYAQIAERIGSTPRAVKRSVMKSYDKLRNELQSESAGSPKKERAKVVGGHDHGQQNHGR